MRPPLAVFGTSFRYFRRTNLEGSRFLPARRICLAADFLDTGYTHCLWWDSDIIATPDQVARLLSHDEAIVGGLYANKSERRLKWVLNPFGETTPNDNRGILPVRHIGTGFLLVAREVFETMIKKTARHRLQSFR